MPSKFTPTHQLETMPTTTDSAVSNGAEAKSARKRGITSVSTGCAARVRRASICSVTFIVPNSAVMEAPTRPVSIKAASTGPNSLLMPMLTTAPVAVSIFTLWNCRNVWAQSTIPVAAPVVITTLWLFTPMKWSW